MDDRFFEAWITRRWKVCGKRLKPLCLGHVVNLEAINSPLAPYRDFHPETPITPGDLLLAVKICSEQFPHPASLKPTLRDVAWRIALERSPERFRFHAMLFAAYRNDHCSSPEFWISEEEEGGRPISAPIALSKAAFLLSNTNLSEERVWSMPLGRVDYLIASIEERKTGAVRFFYEDEAEAVAPEIEGILSEEEIIETARRELSPPAFDHWLSQRMARKEAA